MATVERIPKPSLPDVANGDIVYADDYNRDNEVIRAGVNANYADMQKIVQGKTFVLIAPNGDMNMLRLASNFILEFSLDGVKWFPTYATGPAGPPGPGIIPGGKAGQVLAKQSDVNFDTYWVDVLPTWGSIGGNIQDQTDLIELFSQINVKSARLNITIQVSQWTSEGIYRLENPLIKATPNETNQEWVMPALPNLTQEQKITILALNLLDNGQGEGWAEIKAKNIPTIDIPMTVILRGEV